LRAGCSARVNGGWVLHQQLSVPPSRALRRALRAVQAVHCSTLSNVTLPGSLINSAFEPSSTIPTLTTLPRHPEHHLQVSAVYTWPWVHLDLLGWPCAMHTALLIVADSSAPHSNAHHTRMLSGTRAWHAASCPRGMIRRSKLLPRASRVAQTMTSLAYRCFTKVQMPPVNLFRRREYLQSHLDGCRDYL
jgi:hypothetical protein